MKRRLDIGAGPSIAGRSLNGIQTLLTFPPHERRFVEKAAMRGADLLVLDLEDSVPLAEKDRARRDVSRAIRFLRSRGAFVGVRINAEPNEAALDIRACSGSPPDVYVVPKVTSAATLKDVSRLFYALPNPFEKDVPLMATIEHPAALCKLDEISRFPRTHALAFGSEDFAASIGVDPSVEALAVPAQLVALAGRASGIATFGVPGPVGLVDPIGAFARLAVRARQLGFSGIPCIHPKQLAAVRKAFAPTPGEVRGAKRVLAAFSRHAGKSGGAILHEGRMVDSPVLQQARNVLERQRTARARET